MSEHYDTTYDNNVCDVCNAEPMKPGWTNTEDHGLDCVHCYDTGVNPCANQELA